MSERLVSEGARELRRYLKRTGQSVPTFCEAHGLERIRVARYLKGERTHATVDFAQKIEEATAGEVPIHAWSTRTLAPIERPKKRTGTDGR